MPREGADIPREGADTLTEGTYIPREVAERLTEGGDKLRVVVIGLTLPKGGWFDYVGG